MPIILNLIGYVVEALLRNALQEQPAGQYASNVHNFFGVGSCKLFTIICNNEYNIFYFKLNLINNKIRKKIQIIVDYIVFIVIY